MARRDEEMRAETARRDKVMRAQMDLIRGLVEGARGEKWMKGCDTVEKLQDVLVLEQFVNTLPADVRAWVQEHKPNTSEVAAQLADDPRRV